MNSFKDKMIMTELFILFWGENIDLPNLFKTIVARTVDSVQREFLMMK